MNDENLIRVIPTFKKVGTQSFNIYKYIGKPRIKTGKELTINLLYNPDNHYGFRDNKQLDVYVTGSNSKMLSADIATEFRGRSSRINVHPLSFKEYFNMWVGMNKKHLMNI